MPTPASSAPTAEDLLALKEAASGQHGGAQGQVFHLLAPYNRRRGGRHPGGWIFATEVLVYFGADLICSPDVVGWRRERLPALPADVPARVVPDWTCEIVVPSDRREDLERRMRGYHQANVPHCWLVGLGDQTLTGYRWAQEGYVQISVQRWARRAERARVEPFDAVELQVGVFFGEEERE